MSALPQRLSETVPLSAPRQRRNLLQLLTTDMATRTLIGALLALLAMLMVAAGGYVFAGFVALAALACTREWHRLIGKTGFAREWLATAAATTAVSLVSVGHADFALQSAIILAGAVFAGVLGALRGVSAFGSAMGSLYVGIPAASLVALRSHSPSALWVVLGMFLVIWTADTGALLVGRIFGGPKLVPSLSPNKTWSGLAGGLMLPGLVAAGYVWMFNGNPWRGLLVGFVLATAGHAGDLFESWVKRLVGRKDSGESLPGHGGVLDRLDSTLFVAPLMAALVFGLDALRFLGVQP